MQFSCYEKHIIMISIALKNMMMTYQLTLSGKELVAMSIICKHPLSADSSYKVRYENKHKRKRKMINFINLQTDR